MLERISPSKVVTPELKKINGISGDERYLHLWGTGYQPGGYTMLVGIVHFYDRTRKFALDGMLVCSGQDVAAVTANTVYIFTGGGGGNNLTDIVTMS
ncbi:MAG: hypothetical protein RBG13Loki_2106 [Promethearchaeota archaeon CR_4]|nr:MAG: hypothetical protein RBG13Loki_2106 [Candidatus Lokiarchaeota archaeon CR_4]